VRRRGIRGVRLYWIGFDPAGRLKLGKMSGSSARQGGRLRDGDGREIICLVAIHKAGDVALGDKRQHQTENQPTNMTAQQKERHRFRKQRRLILYTCGFQV